MGCKASTEVGNVEPLGLVCRWKKRKKKMSHDGEDLSAAKPERGRLRGTLGGRYNQTRRKEVQTGTAGGLGSQSGVDGMGPQGLSTGRRWSTTCKYRNALRGTYAGDRYDASGRQRGTRILSMGPTRAVNGAPKVDNVRS